MYLTPSSPTVLCHYSRPVHRRDTQPDQLCVLHQLSVLWSNHCWPPLPPQEETQHGQTHQGTET